MSHHVRVYERIYHGVEIREVSGGAMACVRRWSRGRSRLGKTCCLLLIECMVDEVMAC